ncbi:hypothetical protein T552_01206 [Pneumocystis carinii B80]|uniref:Dynein light intermediate chain n=1 Tax=Pneumocystis carinii (strain B80) TaxID=1408658 RepID=A0A0W4ZLL0_PNEC8|nr:hypothetical protein T552_01206 [Pneumocystis carinii B80]KTW29251.1 hypothetical protein T552_01206 [Pneumocystis carinii B80]
MNTSVLTTSTSLVNTDDHLWSNLLNSVSGIKKVPSKYILLLGGGNRNAREWISSLKQAAIGVHRKGSVKKNKEEIGSTYLMDYTYIEWMDPDQGERLGVIEVYLISERHVSCESMLLELFTPEFLKNCLICILLDWRNPWKWHEEMYNWINLIRKSIESFKSHEEGNQVISDIIATWEYKIRTYSENSQWVSHDVNRNEQVLLPLETNQYDQPLGLPLICVCNHSEYILSIEKDELLKDEHFDFIQQFLRTILMKHGGALYYTSDLYPNTLDNLLYSILDCFSLSPQTYMDVNSPPKANVIDGNQIFVPPGWDSWGKIRIIRDSFDVEKVANAWDSDLNLNADNNETLNSKKIFEEMIVDSRKNDIFDISETNDFVTTIPYQEFLLNHLNIIETKCEPQENVQKDKINIENTYVASAQLNIGGVKLNTEEVDEKLKKLRDIRSESNSPVLTPEEIYKSPLKAISPLPAKEQNEVLANFFQSLLNRKKAGG